MRTTAMLAAMLVATVAQAQTHPGEADFRALYKELVETDTTLSAGDCTLAATRVAARMKAAGFTDDQLTIFTAPDHPKEGGLVAVYPGRDAATKPMLLLAHIDVVEAKREDWTRDPFTLVEEGGYFYARGASDDKAQAAIWADTLIRFRQEGFRPRRTIKLALTCGEETTYAFNGAQYLADNRRALIDAAFALNEGGGGMLDEAGKPVTLTMMVGEKASQNYRLTVTNPGGHSSRPVKPNAIAVLARALDRLDRLEFPVNLNATTRAFFSELAPTSPPPLGAAMRAIVANPGDTAADATLSANPTFHSMLRTTCVSTLVEAGHANNALAQRATANINCRIAPGETVEATQAALAATIADPAVAIALVPPIRPVPGPPPLSDAIVAPARALAARHFPGVPMVPTMSTGATDGIFLFARGIPTYGVPGIFADPDYGRIHGLNERIRVKSVLDGRDYLYDLVKAYANTR